MKRILSMLCVMCFSVQIVFSQTVAAAEVNQSIRQYVQDKMPNDGQCFLEKEENNVKKLIVSCKKEFGINVMSEEELFIGEPFAVDDNEQLVQEETLYYPIQRVNSQSAVAILSLINTTVGWQYSIDTNWVDELNRSGYLQSKEDYLFYVKDGQLCAEKSNNVPLSKTEKDYQNNSFEIKKKQLKEKMKKWKKVDVEENRNKRNVLKYSPTVTNELGYYYCNINNAQGQGPYGLCWAATTATIVNYLRGTNRTAKNVADALKIGYDDGGTRNDIVRGLSYYGVNEYAAYSGTESFSEIRSQIEEKHPMAMLGWAANGAGHAVTLYGYRNLTSGQYVMLWNSALNNNKGGMTVTSYKSSGMTFATGSTNFTWGQTVKQRAVSYK